MHCLRIASKFSAIWVLLAMSELLLRMGIQWNLWPLYIKDLCLLSHLYSTEIEVCCWGLNGLNTHQSIWSHATKWNYYNTGSQQCSQMFIGEICPIVVVHTSHSSQSALSRVPGTPMHGLICQRLIAISPLQAGGCSTPIRIHIKWFSGICRAQESLTYPDLNKYYNFSIAYTYEFPGTKDMHYIIAAWMESAHVITIERW